LVVITEKQSVKTFDELIDDFAKELRAVAILLNGLNTILSLNKDVNLKEGSIPFLQAFKNAQKNITPHLVNLEGTVAWLRSTLVNEKPPYLIRLKGLNLTLLWAENVNKELSKYKKETKGTLAPQLSNEEVRLKRIISNFNTDIVTINLANKPFKIRPYPLIKIF